MKKILFLAGLVLLAAACSTEENEEAIVNNPVENPTEATAPVTVHVDGFTQTMSGFSDAPSMTRSVQDAANYNNVKCLTLAFYSGSTEVYKQTQLKSDNTTYTTFGEFTCNLPLGTYTLVAIGRNYWDGDEFTLTSPTVAGYTSERPRETFSYTQSVTITGTEPLALSVTLERVVAQLSIQSTDGRPENITKIRTTFAAGSKSFNPTTGLALDNVGFSQTNTPSGEVDAPINIYSIVFLNSDEQTMTITIQALDDDDKVVYTKVVPNVQLKRNRKTTLSGVLFSPGGSSQIKLETDWLEGNTINF